MTQPDTSLRAASNVIFELKHASNPDMTRSFDPSAQLIVGRDANACNVVFGPECGMVSRVHCKLYSLGRDVLVQDWSSNGTYINSRPLGKSCTRRIQSGDTLCLIAPTLPDAKKYMWTFMSSVEMEEHKKAQQKHDAAASSTSADASSSSVSSSAFSASTTAASSSSGDKKQHNIVDHYELRETLGSGNFATVRLGISRNPSNRQHVAVKIVQKKRFAMGQDEFQMGALLNESEILRRMSHENIVKVFDVFDDAENFTMVLELVRGGDLFDYIVGRGPNPFSEGDGKKLFLQLLEAQLYMNSKRITHRDLKPENILVAVDPEFYASLPPGANATANAPRIPVSKVTLKVTDFGLAKFCGDSAVMKTMCGTPTYLAPEVMMENKGASGGHRESVGYGPAVDIWSLGVVLFILLSGTTPKNAHTTGVQFTKHFNQTSSHALDLVTKMLTIDPRRRATLEDICNHPWLAGVEIKGRAWAKNAEAAEELKPTMTLAPGSFPGPTLDNIFASSSLSSQGGNNNNNNGASPGQQQLKPLFDSQNHQPQQDSNNNNSTNNGGNSATKQANSQQHLLGSPINIPTKPKNVAGEETDQDSSSDDDDDEERRAKAGARRQRQEDKTASATAGSKQQQQPPPQKQDTFQRPDSLQPPSTQVAAAGYNSNQQQQQQQQVSSPSSGAPLSHATTIGMPTPAPITRAIWMWKSDLEKEDEDMTAYQQYSAVDSAAIEKASKKNKLTCSLPSQPDLRVSFAGMFQFRTSDSSRQRAVRRWEITQTPTQLR